MDADPLAPLDLPAGAIPLGPVGSTPAEAPDAPDAAALATPLAIPAAEPVPDSGMIKGAEGMVNLEALAELTTLDEIELLATQPMPSIVQPGNAQPAAPAQAQGESATAREEAEQAVEQAPDGHAAPATPVTVDVMVAPPAHGAVWHGASYDTTPLPQMTAPLPVADLEAFLPTAPAAPDAPDVAANADEESD